MAHDNERADVVAEMSLLQKQQLESFDDATFFGWTPDAKADHDKLGAAA